MKCDKESKELEEVTRRKYILGCIALEDYTLTSCHLVTTWQQPARPEAPPLGMVIITMAQWTKEYGKRQGNVTLNLHDSYQVLKKANKIRKMQTKNNNNKQVDQVNCV